MYTITVSFKLPIIPLHIQYNYIFTWRNSPCFFHSPSWLPLCSPFVSPSTYLAPSSCDRNRPPQSQVACTDPICPALHPTVPPPPNSQNPNRPAPNKDDLGNIPALAIRNTINDQVYLFPSQDPSLTVQTYQK
jgi:hypothetical protein